MALLITHAQKTSLFSLVSEAARDASNFNPDGTYKQHVLYQVSAMIGKNITEIEVVYTTAVTMYEDMEEMRARISLGEMTQLRGRDDVCGFVTHEGEGVNGWWEVCKHPISAIKHLKYLENNTFAYWNEFADIAEALENHRHILPPTLFSPYGPRVSHLMSFVPPPALGPPIPQSALALTAPTPPAPPACQSPYPPLPVPILPAPVPGTPAFAALPPPAPTLNRKRGPPEGNITASLPVHPVRSSYPIMLSYHEFRISTVGPLSVDRIRPDGTSSTRKFNTSSNRYPEWPLARELDNVILDSRSSPNGRWQCSVAGCKFDASGAPCKTTDSLYRHFRTQHLQDKKDEKLRDLGRGTLVAVGEEVDTEFRERL